MAMGFAFAMLVFNRFGLAASGSAALSEALCRAGFKQDSIQRHAGYSNCGSTIGFSRIGGHLDVDLNSFNGVRSCLNWEETPGQVIGLSLALYSYVLVVLGDYSFARTHSIHGKTR